MKESKNITFSHRNDLNNTREIISNLIAELTLFSNGDKTKEFDIEYWNLMWGEKENVTSVMVKLSNMLLKIIPLEQELSEKDQANNKNNVDESVKIEENDREIIKRYIKKYSNNN